MSRLPTVRDGTLHTAPYAAPVPVGTQQWFAWLLEARSFTFAGTAGTFTARQEERSGRHFCVGAPSATDMNSRQRAFGMRASASAHAASTSRASAGSPAAATVRTFTCRSRFPSPCSRRSESGRYPPNMKPSRT